ncbi:hypothetical protein VdG1_01579 [Verticillium dahliae VDG1]|nr:hypothetical protein VdG1_01579 [Verticillium dahliae VDG1]
MRLLGTFKALGVALLATTASAVSIAPRQEAAALDLTSLAILTKAADTQVQTTINNKQNLLKGQPRAIARAVRQLVTPFVWPNSTYYHDESLLPHIEEMMAALTKRQHCDGTYSVGNRHSPPDTGFLIEDFGIMVRILEKDDHDNSQAIADEIRAILVKAGPGLAKGGIHTPNHRWKICAALARISTITGDESLIKRIDEWLAEGIDIDADGIYSERSPNYYSAVSNPSLLTVARELNYTDLIPFVRKNLELSIEHAEPNGEIETIQSRRQDQTQPGLRFVPNFFTMGHFRSNGIKYDSDGTIRLGSEMEVPYYLPMPADQRDENGVYALGRSVADGRFYAMLDFANRPTSMRRLKTDVTISPTKAGYDIAFEVTGEQDVELTFELTFRGNGTFKGVKELTNVDGVKTTHLVEGTGEYSVGNDKITFGPGIGEGLIVADGGEQYSWHAGALVLKGQKVYITGTSPLKYTLNLGFS